LVITISFQPVSSFRAIPQSCGIITNSCFTFASFNGLVWKKGIDDSWLQNGRQIEPEQIIIRYADILLMYAEAKIELNEIDKSVLDAMNLVRARAYKVALADANYPAIKNGNQVQLRKQLRMERRMELAAEGMRYMDLVRWRLAEKVLTRPIYGLLDPKDLKEKVMICTVKNYNSSRLIKCVPRAHVKEKV
jgi:hypothetical protein